VEINYEERCAELIALCETLYEAAGMDNALSFDELMTEHITGWVSEEDDE
jgi:hypothetical protein